MAKKDKVSVPTGDYEYGVLKAVDKSTGKVLTSKGNADAVQKAMLLYMAAGGTTSQLAKDNGLKMTRGDRNEGLFRMAVGNALRGLVRAGTPVKIGRIKVEKLTQKVDMPKVEGATPARATKRKAKVKRAARKPRSTSAPASVQEAAAEAA